MRESLLGLDWGRGFKPKSYTGIGCVGFGPWDLRVQSTHFAENPADNVILLLIEIGGEKREFEVLGGDLENSNPNGNVVYYKLPPIQDIIGLPDDLMNTVDVLTAEVRVRAPYTFGKWTHTMAVCPPP